MLSLVLFGCHQEDNTQVVEIDDIIPEAKGNYEYDDSSKTEVTQDDYIRMQLSHFFNGEVQTLNKLDAKIEGNWRYIPDRLASDSSLSRYYLIDSSAVLLKKWKYKDSVTTINAFYNWLDCFGDDCSSISIGDSIGVSKNAFLLFQNDLYINFVQSPKRLNKNKWEEFFFKEQKNTSWNYVLSQTPGGIIKWVFNEN